MTRKDAVNSMARSTARQRGTIKRLVREKGFGFITAETGGDIFFHRSGFEGDWDRLREGISVTFAPGETTAKGPRAEDVQLD